MDFMDFSSIYVSLMVYNHRSVGTPYTCEYLMQEFDAIRPGIFFYILTTISIGSLSWFQPLLLYKRSNGA